MLQEGTRERDAAAVLRELADHEGTQRVRAARGQGFEQDVAFVGSAGRMGLVPASGRSDDGPEVMVHGVSWRIFSGHGLRSCAPDAVPR